MDKDMKFVTRALIQSPYFLSAVMSHTPNPAKRSELRSYACEELSLIDIDGI